MKIFWGFEKFLGFPNEIVLGFANEDFLGLEISWGLLILLIPYCAPTISVWPRLIKNCNGPLLMVLVAALFPVLMRSRFI